MEAKQIVNGADDDVHRGGVPRLSAEVVLKVCVVTLAEKLKKPKEALCEEVVGEDLTEYYEERDTRGKLVNGTRFVKLLHGQI